MKDEREANPYESPLHGDSLPTERPNTAGRVGFVLSLLGFAGIVMALSATAIDRLFSPIGTVLGVSGIFVSFLSLPGLLVSIIGLFRVPRRLAGWGVVLGIIVLGIFAWDLIRVIG